MAFLKEYKGGDRVSLGNKVKRGVKSGKREVYKGNLNPLACAR